MLQLFRIDENNEIDYDNSLWIWLQHVRVNEIDNGTRLSMPRRETFPRRPLPGLLRLTEDTEAMTAVSEDTRKPGHNEIGFVAADLFQHSSHVTVAKVYATVDRNAGPLGVGAAVCSIRDQFNRQRGRETAMRRALGKALKKLIICDEVNIDPDNNVNERVVYYYEDQR